MTAARHPEAVNAGHAAYRQAVEMDRVPFGDALSVGMNAAINHALADNPGAVKAALLSAPMPEVESVYKGEDWAERYNDWWHEHVRPLVVEEGK